MRLLVVILLLSLVGSSSCKKDSKPQEGDSEIIGVDTRLCACCGGWWLRIDGDSARALDFPGNFGDSVKVDSLPLPVVLTWDKNGVPQCLNENIIHIITIRKK